VSAVAGIFRYLIAVANGRIARWNRNQGRAFGEVYRQVNQAFPSVESIHQAALLAADLLVGWFFNPVSGTFRKRAPETQSQYDRAYALLVPGFVAFVLLDSKHDLVCTLHELSDALAPVVSQELHGLADGGWSMGR